MVTFGERLKLLRTKRKLLQKEVAAAVGVKRGTLAAWETEPDRLPEAKYLIKLADFFGVSVDYLLGKTDDPSPKPSESLDLEIYLQKILSGEIPIHFSGVEKLTPEIEEDIRAVLRAALSHIRLQKEAAKKAGGSRKGVEMWNRNLQKEDDELCSSSGSVVTSAMLSLPSGRSTPTTSPPASVSSS